MRGEKGNNKRVYCFMFVKERRDREQERELKAERGRQREEGRKRAREK